jgi:hypothetical protein
MRDYEDVNIHAPSEKLTLTGLMQVMAVAEHPDTHWQSGVNLNLGDQRGKPFVGLTGDVSSARNEISFALRWGTEPSQRTSYFAVMGITVGHRSKRLHRLPSSFSDHAWL